MAKGQMTYRRCGVRQHIALWALLLLTCAAPALAQPAIPALSGRVVDQADILSSSTENALTALLKAHEEETSNQVAVLTIPSLEGTSIESYSLEVAQTWGLGTAQNDNGVLLLVAVEDRAMRIEVGLGLESFLTDVLAGRIIRNDITPYFRSGDFDGGVLAGVRSIVGVIEGSYTPPEDSYAPEDEVPIFFRLIFALMFILMPLLAFVPSFLIAGQWGNLGFMGLFIVVGGFVSSLSLMGAVAAAVGYMILLLMGNALFRRQENWREMRKKVADALKENRGRRVKVTIGGFTFNAGGITSSSGGSSRSGGGWSGGGGGGFSGGGGSFGGGGASGSW